MTIDPWNVLTPDQQRVARAFIADRDRDRKHLVIYLSGAHAYGFPSPDSDLDLKCIHIAPTSDLVGLAPSDDPPDHMEIIDGVELDYGSNELTPVLRGAMKGNGNFLERFLGDLVLGGDTALLAEARPIIQNLLSRRAGRHYGGFATSQLRLFDEKPTAKRALYVLRTAATGKCLLDTGKLITDVTRMRDFVPREIDELLAIKRTGERQTLESDQVAAWRPRLTAAIDAIDKSWPTSVLPPDPGPEAITALDAWLRDVRKRHW